MILNNILIHLSLFVRIFSLFRNNLVSFWKAPFSISTRLGILVSHLAASFRTLLSYLNVLTCVMPIFPIRGSYVPLIHLLKIIFSVFLEIMLISFLIFKFTKFCGCDFSFLSVSVINNVPAAYLILSECSPIINPSRFPFRWGGQGEKTHPCLTPLSNTRY